MSPKSLTFKRGTTELSFSISAIGGPITGNVGAPALPFSLFWRRWVVFALARRPQKCAGTLRTERERHLPVDNCYQQHRRSGVESIGCIDRQRGLNRSNADAHCDSDFHPNPNPDADCADGSDQDSNPTGTATATASNWRVIAWNDLGMHCMDSDYSVFSLLPPFNVLHAQAIDANGHLVTDASTASLTYEAVADPTGSINTSSAGKPTSGTLRRRSSARRFRSTPVSRDSTCRARRTSHRR